MARCSPASSSALYAAESPLAGDVAVVGEFREGDLPQCAVGHAVHTAAELQRYFGVKDAAEVCVCVDAYRFSFVVVPIKHPG